MCHTCVCVFKFVCLAIGINYRAICLTEKENGVKMQRRLRKTVGLCPALDCIYSSGVDRQIEGSVELCQGLPSNIWRQWNHFQVIPAASPNRKK